MRQIDLSDSVYITELAINSLFSLTQEGAHLCRIIAKVRGMYGLIWSKNSNTSGLFYLTY